MLKFFKRQKSRRGEKTEDVDDKNDVEIVEYVKRHSLRSTSSFCDEVFLPEESFEDDSQSCGGGLSLGATSTVTSGGIDEDIFKYQSRLSMSLLAILNDPNCLSYFIQYLETKNSLPLIKFYLDTENFKTVAVNQLEKFQIHSDKEENCNSPEKHGREIDEVDEGDGDNNSVPELKTLCDLSMHKPLTDDEKSQIYAETNKQIIKCNNNINNNKLQATSELSVWSESTTTTDAEPESDCGREPNTNVASACITDAIAIYQKYLIVNAKQFVVLPVAILSQISLALCKSNTDDFERSENLQVSPNCFDEAQHYVLEQLEDGFLNDFLQSIFYCKFCIELIEGASGKREDVLTIYDILYSEVTLFFFMEYLEQHDERECLDFWTAAINFRKTFTAVTSLKNEMEVQADAMIIYDKFFSLQSDSRLWMSDKLRCRVEERICAVGQVPYCFDLPLQIIAKYLDKKYLVTFLKSQLFENYFNELKTKIHEELSIGSISNDSVDGNAGIVNLQKLSFKHTTNNKTSNHRKSLSDCTNETTRDLFKHISQQNTLLAMDTTHLKNLNSTGTNLSIDSRHITNPNLLWHRSTSTEGGLTFGRVNSLGRYERDFESVDAYQNIGKHNWSLSIGSNKIKNVVRKLVNLPEDKVQEEIAWQVAEMIVKDVTSVTLNSATPTASSAYH